MAAFQNMIHSGKKIFIKSVFIALMGACCVVAIDVAFSLMAPLSYLSMRSNTLFEKTVVFAMDGVLAYHVLFLAILTGGILGQRFVWTILSAATILYLISWAVFIIVGEFLGIEGVRFVAYNFMDIVWMMGQISKWNIVLLAGLMASPLLVYAMTRKFRKCFSDGHKLVFSWDGFSFFAAVILLTLLLVLPGRISSKNKFDLRYRVSPLATLCFDRAGKNIPEGYEPTRNYLDLEHRDIISWTQYLGLQHQEVKAVPVIVMVIESLRSDVLDSDTVMPNLFALKQDGILIKPYSSSNQTDAAWPALLSSQYPMRSDYHYYYPQKVPFPRVTIYDVLKQAGFATAIFSAQNERWGGMYNFLNTGTLDVFMNAEFSNHDKYASKEDSGFASYVKKFGLVGKMDDGAVIDEAMQWAGGLHSSKFFIGLNFQRPHFPYTWPDTFKPPFSFCPPQPWSYDRRMVPLVRNRYLNALRYTDAQIGRFIRFLKDKGLYDQSIICVLGDHGEAFYEHGAAEHAGQLFNETAITALVIKGSYQALGFVSPKVPELMDMPPTISQMLGLIVHPAFQGNSWLDPRPIQKPVFITVNSPIAKQDAIVEHNWKLINDYRTGRTMLFNLVQDPKEQHNILNQNPQKGRELMFKLLFWRLKQIEYYSTESLNGAFYPPQFSSKTINKITE